MRRTVAAAVPREPADTVLQKRLGTGGRQEAAERRTEGAREAVHSCSGGGGWECYLQGSEGSGGRF